MPTRKAAALAVIATLNAYPAAADSGEQTIPEVLQNLGREADILGEEARGAIEMLLPMIESMMDRLPLLIDSLPEYEAPVILPNGDILIRRKPNMPDIQDDWHEEEQNPGGLDGLKT